MAEHLKGEQPEGEGQAKNLIRAEVPRHDDGGVVLGPDGTLTTQGALDRKDAELRLAEARQRDPGYERWRNTRY